jgi:hypothetical protein
MSAEAIGRLADQGNDMSVLWRFTFRFTHSVPTG